MVERHDGGERAALPLRSPRRAGLAVLWVLLTWLVAAAPASAGVTHNYLGTFESPGVTGGIAIDESTGNLYLFDTNSGGTIFKYNASGEPVDFSVTGTNEIEGVGRTSFGEIAVDNSSGPAKGDIYVPVEEAIDIYSPAGDLIGRLDENVSSEVPGAPWGEPLGVSVDSHGDVYVDLFPGHVNKYVPSASPVANTDYASSLAGLKRNVDVAADAEGNVYVGVLEQLSSIHKYEAMQFGALQASGTLVAEGSWVPTVDLATGDLYADAESQIQIYGPAGNLLEKINPPAGTPAAFNGSQAVAVNAATGEVYVASHEGFVSNRIITFGPAVVVPDATTERPALTSTTVTLKGVVNPSGTASECYFEYGTEMSYGQTVPCSASPGSGSQPVEVSAELTELEPGPLYHVRLVATNANGSAFGNDVTFALPVPPQVATSWATGVQISTATINASIRAMSYETSFHVEYGPDQSYGSSAPVPDADVGSEAGERTVVEHLTGLQPGTTYHYRVVASNANGSVAGPDKTFATFAPLAVNAADSCPNAVYRTGFSAGLPDCRAYEMVSPVEKNGADVNAQDYKEFTAADSGEAIQFPARTGIGDTHGSGNGGYTQFIARRGADGWSTSAITPTPALNVPLQFASGFTSVLSFSQELDRAIVWGYDLPGATGGGPNAENLYLEDTSDAQLLGTVSRFEGIPEGHPARRADEMFLGGSSADLGVTTFQLNENLVPQATGTNPKVYAWEHGTVKLVGILPGGGVPSGGSVLARESSGAVGFKDTVSRDGSRIFFMSPAQGNERQLYVRKNGSSTALVSESEMPAPAPATDVNFQAATADGTKVVFSTESRLLESDPGGPGIALYLYKQGPHPESESNLTFIARFSGEGEGTVGGRVVKGMSEDASHIYFDSEYTEALPFRTPGGGLFLWDEGAIRQVAPEPGAPEEGAFEDGEEADVSADGSRIAFMNARALTKQDFRGFALAGSTGDTAMYLYDDNSRTLRCVSCAPSGAAVTLGVEKTVTATSPSNPGFEVSARPHFMSSDGRYVFFNTREGLLPQDINGVTDAYEYDTDTGKLSLLSPGTGETGTWFVEASQDGRDAFLVTRQPLSRSDPDKLVDLYDARIGGGFPEPPPPGTPCSGDACQGTPSAAPSFNVASGFTGPGNPAAPPTNQTKARSLTRAQKLRSALAACAKLASGHKRALCKARARKRYAPKRTSRKAAHRHGR